MYFRLLGIRLPQEMIEAIAFTLQSSGKLIDPDNVAGSLVKLHYQPAFIDILTLPRRQVIPKLG